MCLCRCPSAYMYILHICIRLGVYAGKRAVLKMGCGHYVCWSMCWHETLHLCPYISVLMELFVRVQCSHNMSVHCCECVCQQLSVAIHFYSLCRMKSLRSAPALKCRNPRPDRCSHDFWETEPGGKDGVQGNTLI